MMKKAFIVPDVHGREFWKEAREAIMDDNIEKVIFLGDYFDPYDDEGLFIDHDDLVNSFTEIVEFKKANPDRVILLLGNHDVHYLYKNPYCSRHDGEHEDDYCALIKDNLDCFKLMHLEDVDVKGYTKMLFTHAGLTSGFIKALVRAEYPKDDIIAIVNTVNDNFLASKTHENHVLSELLLRVSRFRGGDYYDGSFLWADIREVVPNKFDFDDVYQIFGHTRSWFPTVMKRYAMLDTQECYIADFENGVLINTNTKKEFFIQ